MRNALAFDFGASGARAVLGSFDGERLFTREAHRFPNEPSYLAGRLYWDLPRLMHEVERGMALAVREGGFDSVGVDTWGVDCGLLDRRGALIANPYHYRDDRLNGILERACDMMPADALYRLTGVQIMQINTLYQLLWLKENDIETLERADRLLMMPGLFNYFLCGVKCAETTIASTTQMLDPFTRRWNTGLLDAFGLPGGILPELTETGAILGALRPDVATRTGAGGAVVVNVCGHDTACAVLAVPARGKDFAYISSGTWSLLGTELDAPVINTAAARYNFTNEAGYGGTTRFLKNIDGLWRLQQFKQSLESGGAAYTYAGLEALADAAEPGVGAELRGIYEGLAGTYRTEFGYLEEITGRRFDRLYVVGGGSRDALLSRLTAQACGVSVECGPAEATSLGNICAQLIALGELRDASEARELVARSQARGVYGPE